MAIPSFERASRNSLPMGGQGILIEVAGLAIPSCIILRDQAQGVIPQGIDLYGLAVTRGEHRLSTLGIHPGQLGWASPPEIRPSVSAWMSNRVPF